MSLYPPSARHVEPLPVVTPHPVAWQVAVRAWTAPLPARAREAAVAEFRRLVAEIASGLP